MPTQDVKPPRWLQISEAAQTLAQTLLERYPAAFCAEPAGVRPLKIRIDRDIRQALGVPRQVVSEVLCGYTYRHAYRAALAAPGAMRVDLDGQPVAPVSPADQAAAQQRYRLGTAASGHAACADSRFHPISAARRETHGGHCCVKVCPAGSPA